MSKFSLIPLIIFYLIGPIFSIVQLKPVALSFPDSPARFTKELSGGAICGRLQVADPHDACSELLNEVDYKDATSMVLIVRGKCAFDEKIRNAQDAGFRAAVVYDDQNNQNLISMTGNPEGIWIHAVFVSNVAGKILRNHSQEAESECCIVSILVETAWTVLVISFISVLAVVSLLTTIFFTYSHRRPRNFRERRAVVHEKAVQNLPCIKFSSLDPNSHSIGEMCAICLEDYIHGENVKVLPCQHDFHASCVVSWLINWATFCPICKHDVRTKISSSVK